MEPWNLRGLSPDFAPLPSATHAVRGPVSGGSRRERGECEETCAPEVGATGFEGLPAEHEEALR